MNKQLFGAYIAENRKRLGMTQTQLAARLHVTDKAVSKWERGLSYPDVTLLEPLAEALSVSIDALLRCRMPADEGKEQTMTEERSSEPIQTVMEISKETVQKKTRQQAAGGGAGRCDRGGGGAGHSPRGAGISGGAGGEAPP